MQSIAPKSRQLLAAALAVRLLGQPELAAADDWLSGEDATGTWGGARTTLEEHGLHIDVDYMGEAFVRDAKAIAYRGNLDIVLELDTEKAGLWRGGTALAYFQHDHGDGVSDELGLAMPVSNFEAESFTQVSELWLYQELPHGVALRLGKQDANRDFAGPRFGGNFVNSSFGVLPMAPMPSFPAPALGAAMFVQAREWLNLRLGMFDGAPRVESFEGSAFEEGGGLFTIGAAELTRGTDGPRDLVCQLGGWHHSSPNRSGLLGIADLLIRLPDAAGRPPRSFQFFVRGNYEPGADDPNAEYYIGGGATAHGFTGANNTVGLGMGFVEIDGNDEGFIELFFKWRPLQWLTLQPDLQFYFLDDDSHVLFGLRSELKL